MAGPPVSPVAAHQRTETTRNLQGHPPRPADPRLFSIIGENIYSSDDNTFPAHPPFKLADIRPAQQEIFDRFMTRPNISMETPGPDISTPSTATASKCTVAPALDPDPKGPKLSSTINIPALQSEEISSVSVASQDSPTSSLPRLLRPMAAQPGSAFGGDLTSTIQSASNDIEGAYTRWIEQLKLELAAAQDTKMLIQADIDKWTRKLEEQTTKTSTLEGMLRSLETQRQELRRCFEK